MFLQGSHIKIHMNREVPVQVCLTLNIHNYLCKVYILPMKAGH